MDFKWPEICYLEQKNNRMKPTTSFFIATCLIATTTIHAQGQSKLEGLLKKVTAGTNKNNTTKTTTAATGTTATGTPTSLEMGQGIKQALEIGIAQGADKLSLKDGFLGNMAVKILFPPEAEKVEKTLRAVGLGSLADKVIVSMNRAAEDAAKEAKPIFMAAIKKMTVKDATNILLGDTNSATDYFKNATTSQLMEKFKPVITTSLNKVGATKYWTQAASEYNKLPLVKSVNTDLSDYATQKAIDGMFIQIAQEETKIRGNVGARSTSLLQKVFGYADKNK